MDAPSRPPVRADEPAGIASNLMGAPYDTLDERSRKVARHVAAREHISRNVAEDFPDRTRFG